MSELQTEDEKLHPPSPVLRVRGYRIGWLLPWVVLVVALTTTALEWRSEQGDAMQELQSDFDFRARETHYRIDVRMKAYEQILRGVKSLFAASGRVTESKFREYVKSQLLEDHYPGSQGIGFAAIKQLKKKGAAREISAPIKYIESFVGDSLYEAGYDFYADPVFRAALEKARDSGKAVYSAKILLALGADDDPRMQSGFFMFLPIYRNDVSLETLEERKQSVVGWIYMPFRMVDLMTGILGEIATDIDIEIHDSEEISDATMMYDPDASGAGGSPEAFFVDITRMELGEHIWSVVIASLAGFESRLDARSPKLVIFVGIPLSLLLSLLAWLVVRDRTRAIHTAEAINRELAERMRAEARLQYMAHHDALTDLPNRTLFSDRLKQGLAQARRDKSKLALLFLDLDHFKPINDTYGHAVGDLLLKEMAVRMRKCVREADTVSRIGGDEFLVLLPTIDTSHDAVLVAEKMLAALSQTFVLDGRDLHISGSIGIAIYPEHGGNEILLTHQADTAMYYAKSAGRNRAKMYRPDMRDTA